MLQELMQKVSQLNDDEKRDFITWLNTLIDKGAQEPSTLTVMELRKDNISRQGMLCPHCHSSEIVGYGNYRGRKRYLCKKCKRTFNELSGTAIDKVHLKDKWAKYIDCMLQKLSLRETAKRVGICLYTSFYWRHRILSSLNDVGCSHMEGIIEADETFFLYSEKGNKKLARAPRKRGSKASKDGMNDQHVNVIAATDRKGHRAINVGNRGVITKMAIEKAIGKWINTSGSILCSDAHRTFQGYAKQHQMTHKMLYARKKQHVMEGIYHIQNVNSMHSQLKKFIDPFNGVATKYLQNYVNYFRAFNGIKEWKTAMGSVLLDNNVYYGTYKNNQYYSKT